MSGCVFLSKYVVPIKQSTSVFQPHSDRAMSVVSVAPGVQKVGNLLVFFPMDIPKVHELILLTPIKNTKGKQTSLIFV